MAYAVIFEACDCAAGADPRTFKHAPRCNFKHFDFVMIFPTVAEAERFAESMVDDPEIDPEHYSAPVASGNLTPAEREWIEATEQYHREVEAEAQATRRQIRADNRARNRAHW